MIFLQGEHVASRWLSRALENRRTSGIALEKTCALEGSASIFGSARGYPYLGLLFYRILSCVEDPRDVNHIFLNTVKDFKMTDYHPSVFWVDIIFLALVCEVDGFNLFDDLIHDFDCRWGRFGEVKVKDDFKV